MAGNTAPGDAESTVAAEQADWFGDETATFGDRLAAARELSGLTQPELAQRLGVNVATLRMWENDRSEPRANRIQMLAGMLGVSLRWLLSGEGPGLNRPVADLSATTAGAVLADVARLRAAADALAGNLADVERRLTRALREPAE